MQKISFIKTCGNDYFLLDKANGVYEIGDINLTGNGTFFKINDLSKYVRIVQGAISKKFFDIDITNKYFGFGDLEVTGISARCFILYNSFQVVSLLGSIYKLDPKYAGFYISYPMTGALPIVGNATLLEELKPLPLL